MKLQQTYKFLTFQDDNAKHKVVESVTVAELLIMAMFPATAGIVAFVLLLYMSFGIIGAFAAYLASIVLVIEIPHIILDR